jgi:hypothetical protein
MRAVLAGSRVWLAVVAIALFAFPVVPSANAQTAAASLSWSAPAAFDLANGFLASVSCPSASLCVAVDEFGNVATSTDPTGGPSTWSTASIDGSNDQGFIPWTVSCPTTSLCVAVDGDGNAVTSTDGGLNWSDPVVADLGNHLVGISCPSESLCVAVETGGLAARSTDPTDDPAVWTKTNADDFGLQAVSCVPGTQSCVAVDVSGNAVSSTDGGSSWSDPVTNLGADSLVGVSCPSQNLCVAVDTAGNVWSSTDPTDASPTWSSASVDTGFNVFMTAISCASVSLCVVVDSNGNAVTSTDPNAGVASAWEPPVEIDAGDGVSNDPIGVSCPSSSLCAAVDESGNVVTSTDPASGAGTWSIAKVDTATNFWDISCPTASLCVAVDAGGNVFTSTNPAGGASAWSSPIPVSTAQLFGVSCPSIALCVAVDQDGNIVSSTDPTNPAEWSRHNVDGTTPIDSVSCATETLCVAADGPGNVLTSTDPASGTWASAAAAPGSNDPTAVSCPSTSLCVVTEGGTLAGDVLTSTNPTGGAAAWTLTSIDGSNGLDSISCPTASLCAASDDSGNVLTSSDPTGGASAWGTRHVDAAEVPAVSCPSVGLCVGVDFAGNVLMGLSTPSVTTSSAGSIGETTASLAGIVNPNGVPVTDCHFSYGIGTSSGTDVPCSALPGSGTSDVAVSAQLSGLAGGTTYEFRLVAKSAAGTTFGAIGMFTTVGVSLAASKSGSGSGNVTSSPAGISCGATCSHRYAHGTLVTLTATPATGSTFDGWSGGGCSGIGNCNVATNADTTVTATFSLAPETLNVVKSGAGSGSVTSAPSGISCGTTCSHAYAYGTSVTLTATPDAGSRFAGWSGGGCSGTGTCTVTTDADTTVTATFSLIPKTCVVPKVKGKTLSAAKRAIKAHHCSAGRVRHAASRKVKKGHVISQKPKPGSRLKHGAKVNLVVSKGRR